MLAAEELRQSDEVVVTLAHLLAIYGDHVVVYPVMHHLASLCCHSLSNFTFVMREYQVHASSVYVEMLAQVFPAHSRTFTVPSGESLAPGRGPSHDVLGLCSLP